MNLQYSKQPNMANYYVGVENVDFCSTKINIVTIQKLCLALRKPFTQYLVDLILPLLILFPVHNQLTFVKVAKKSRERKYRWEECC